ncbi:MAG TPA: acylphosphatase [Oceanipulchritudo sp.]|nr:acylphosphatase [Oceanipulchritudo sp.]
MKNPRPAVPEREILHATVFFNGRVQGVGFRYHTLQIAKEFEVSGYVRNLDDGRVQVEAEGEEAEVRAFVAEVQDRLSVFIRKTALTEVRRAPHYKGFTIGF